MPPGPTPPSGPCGLAATPPSWMWVPCASSVLPRYGTTARSWSPSAGMLSLARRGRPSLRLTRGTLVSAASLAFSGGANREAPDEGSVDGMDGDRVCEASAAAVDDAVGDRGAECVDRVRDSPHETASDAAVTRTAVAASALPVMHPA